MMLAWSGSIRIRLARRVKGVWPSIRMARELPVLVGNLESVPSMQGANIKSLLLLLLLLDYE